MVKFTIPAECVDYTHQTLRLIKGLSSYMAKIYYQINLTYYLAETFGRPLNSVSYVKIKYRGGRVRGAGGVWKFFMVPADFYSLT
jgi:hypothetical protein